MKIAARERLKAAFRRGTAIVHGRAVWDTIWSGDPYSSESQRMRRAIRRLLSFRAIGYPIQATNSHLDLGCGSGQTLQCLFSAGLLRGSAVGVDISPVAIRIARRQVPPSVSFHEADAHSLPFPDGTFESISAFGVFEHCVDITKTTEEAARVLRPGGRLYLVTSNLASAENILRHIRERTSEYRYGYQHNLSPEDVARILTPRLNTLITRVQHGDWDRFLPTAVDRSMSFIFPSVGRYVFAVAEKTREV